VGDFPFQGEDEDAPVLALVSVDDDVFLFFKRMLALATKLMVGNYSVFVIVISILLAWNQRSTIALEFAGWV